MVNAHTHPVTVLHFSEDGKLLATYAYADSTLNIWQVRYLRPSSVVYINHIYPQISTSMFGISQTPKHVNSWPAISSGVHSSVHGSFIRLEWAGSRSITLHMPGGVECKFSV